MKYLQKNDFNPGWFHPFYFIRNGLYKAISKNAGYISGKVLDFGCGSKPYRNLFQVEEYIGVDFENTGHPHDQEDVDVFYDGKHIPYNDEYFHSIVSSEVFEHLFNIEEVIAELRRVLKKGGHLLVTCPFVWNEHEIPYDYARYTRFALKYLFEKQGFEIIYNGKSGNMIKALAQLYNLYFFRKLYSRMGKFLLTRWIYKLLIVFPINAGGSIASKVFPTDESLYLNNIFIVKKV